MDWLYMRANPSFYSQESLRRAEREYWQSVDLYTKYGNSAEASRIASKLGITPYNPNRNMKEPERDYPHN